MNPRRSNRTLKNIIVICCVVAALVLSNVLYTMVTKAHLRTGTDLMQYARESEQSRTLVANRGYIFDHNGEVIAQDEITYTIYAILDSSHIGIGGVAAYVMDIKMTAEKLAPIMKMEEEDILTYLEKAQANSQYQTEFGYTGKNLSLAQKEEIDALELPGIYFTKSSQRYYPNGKFASNLIGYARYDENEKRIVGQMGVEQYLDEYLQGTDGEERFQSTALGTSIPGTKYVAERAYNGSDVYLTLDRNVQVALEQTMADTMKAFNSQRAWAVIMEVETGRILGYSAYPTFDLNNPDIKEYKDIPSQYLFEPGSVMKGITYAAAIDSGNYPSSDKQFRSGVFHMGVDENGNPVRSDTNVGNGSVKEALGSDFGTISFDEGFTRSSNVGICELLSNYLPTNVFSDYLDRFGFFKKVGMEGVNEEAGVKNFTWPIDKLSTGFGQSSNITTMQMVQAYSAIFNDGKMVKPYYIDKVVDSETKQVLKESIPEVVGQPITKETSQKMMTLMNDVVNNEIGTGYSRFHMDDVEVIGKTGTGEMYIDGGYSSTMFTNSFMAAAPADDPKVMMYYLFESSDIRYNEGSYFKSAFRQALIAAGVTGNAGNEEVSSWQEYEMPSFINHSLDYVHDKTNAMNFNKVIIGDGTSIVKQYPLAKDSVITKQNVFLLTDGATITMPDMSGWSRKDVSQFSEIANIPITIEGSGNVSEQSVKANDVITSESEIIIKLK